MSDIVLTDEQDQLCEILYKWLKNWTPDSKPYYAYSGPPGSGKTTIIREIVKALGYSNRDVHCMALVGNAVMNLSKSGMNAKTVHSSIYDLALIPEKDENGKLIRKPDGSIKQKMDFVLRSYFTGEPKLLLVDETGMLSDPILQDILSFGIPTIFIGDMNQLGPIYGKCSVMEKPDYILTKIMRQKEGDPIIQLCQDILHDRPLVYGEYGKSRVLKPTEIDLKMNLLNDYDRIIVGKNATKEKINSHIREELLGLHPKKPYVGDKVICRANDWSLSLDGYYLVNGMNGTIEDINWSKSNSKKVFIDFKPDFLDDCFYDIPLDIKYLNCPAGEKNDYGMSSYNKFDYGYAITTHLSQGSQYNRVLFMDEYFRNFDFMKRIRYTAISRAIDGIDIVNNMGFDGFYENRRKCAW